MTSWRILAAATGFLAATAGLAQAAEVLDANYTTVNQSVGVAVGSNQWAQTFTVLNTGTLTKVVLPIENECPLVPQCQQAYPIYGEIDKPLRIEIRATSSGAPIDGNSGPQILSTIDIPFGDTAINTGNGVPNLTIDLPDILVTAGQVLAITAWVPTGTVLGTYAWLQDWAQAVGPSDGTYAGGRAFYRHFDDGTWGDFPFYANGSLAPADFGFQVYIDTSLVAAPEPLTVGLFGFGLAGLGLARRRRR